MLWEEEHRLSSAFAKGGILLLSLRLSHQQNCLHHHGSSPFVLKQQEVYFWLNFVKEHEVEGFYMFVPYKWQIMGSFCRYCHHKRNKQGPKRDQTIEFSWALYCLVVLSLLLYVIHASVPEKEPNYGRTWKH